MERSIVHHNHGAFFQGGKELHCKSKFKKGAVHGTAILKRRNNPIRHLGGNNATTFIFAAADLIEYLLATGSIPVFPIQVCIYTAFIHIGNLFWRYVFDLFLIRCYLFPVLLPVPRCLFLRVIFCCRKTYRMPPSLHPNISAISDWYASGCSATYAFNFSGSIFRKLRCNSFFPKSPVSFCCFSHFCMVDLDTLNTWCVSSSVCPACLYSFVRSRYPLE